MSMDVDRVLPLQLGPVAEPTSSAVPTLKVATLNAPTSTAIATDLLARALEMQAVRRRRRTVFPHADAIFHEPAWDVLLDLFVAEAQGRVPDFDALCAVANIRTQTAIRWITTLETLGLVQATATPGTSMPHLMLTREGRDAMLAYLAGD